MVHLVRKLRWKRKGLSHLTILKIFHKHKNVFTTLCWYEDIFLVPCAFFKIGKQAENQVICDTPNPSKQTFKPPTEDRGTKPRMFTGRPCSMLPSWALLHLFSEPSLCRWCFYTMVPFSTEQARSPTTVLETKVGSRDYDCFSGRFPEPFHHQDSMFPSPGLICLSNSEP